MSVTGKPSNTRKISEMLSLCSRKERGAVSKDLLEGNILNFCRYWCEHCLGYIVRMVTVF